MTLQMYVDGQSASPRVYLLDPSGDNYEYLKLNGQEFIYLRCGCV